MENSKEKSQESPTSSSEERINTSFGLNESFNSTSTRSEMIKLSPLCFQANLEKEEEKALNEMKDKN